LGKKGLSVEVRETASSAKNLRLLAQEEAGKRDITHIGGWHRARGASLIIPRELNR
jgi:hypothetical protein